MRELSESDCLSQKKRQKVLLRNSGKGTTLTPPAPTARCSQWQKHWVVFVWFRKEKKLNKTKKTTAHLEVTAWPATFYGI